MSTQEEKNVSFFVTDIGHDIVFEVIDSGIGIPAEKSRLFFKKDFQRKEMTWLRTSKRERNGRS